MKHKDIWTDTIHGVPIEIVRWQLGDKKIWNYYIFLNKNAFTKEDWKRIVPRRKRLYSTREPSYQYYKSPIADLSWHGGISYFEDVGRNTIKAGCDYNHTWDERMTYDEEYVLAEAKKTVKDLIAVFPDMKQRCLGDGVWRPLSDFDEGATISKTFRSKEKYNGKS